MNGVKLKMSNNDPNPNFEIDDASEEQKKQEQKNARKSRCPKHILYKNFSSILSLTIQLLFFL